MIYCCVIDQASALPHNRKKILKTNFYSIKTLEIRKTKGTKGILQHSQEK